MKQARVTICAFFLVILSCIDTTRAGSEKLTTPKEENVTTTVSPVASSKDTPKVEDLTTTTTITPSTTPIPKDPCLEIIGCEDCIQDQNCTFAIFQEKKMCIGKDQEALKGETLTKTIHHDEKCPKKSDCNNSLSCMDCLKLDHCKILTALTKDNNTETFCVAEDISEEDQSKILNDSVLEETLHHAKYCLTEPEVCAKVGGFNSASFFEGIMLTIAVPAVGYLAYRVYTYRRGPAGRNDGNYNIF